jgi:hypothetical protein
MGDIAQPQSLSLIGSSRPSLFVVAALMLCGCGHPYATAELTPKDPDYPRVHDGYLFGDYRAIGVLLDMGGNSGLRVHLQVRYAASVTGTRKFGIWHPCSRKLLTGATEPYFVTKPLELGVGDGVNPNYGVRRSSIPLNAFEPGRCAWKLQGVWYSVENEGAPPRRLIRYGGDQGSQAGSKEKWVNIACINVSPDADGRYIPSLPSVCGRTSEILRRAPVLMRRLGGLPLPTTGWQADSTVSIGDDTGRVHVRIEPAGDFVPNFPQIIPHKEP